MSQNYRVDQSSYAARSAAAYATANASVNNRNSIPSNNIPRAGTFPSLEANQDNSAILENQQSRILNECSNRVQEQAYYMRLAMDEDDLPTALERASFMLNELGPGSNRQTSQTQHNTPGSSKLSPKNYYDLQMKAMDEMPNLEEYFLSLDVEEETVTQTNTSLTNDGYFAGLSQLDINGNPIEIKDEEKTIIDDKKEPLRDLYETVQYCPRVIPRLYLQICAGSALLRSRANKPKNTYPSISVLKDLMDHVKCVQSPVRGLFLRNYVLQIFKHPMDETLEDLYKYLLHNFVEMNQLWVRIQHLPSSRGSHIKIDKKERRKREKERNELRLLVGTNLVRLSELEGMTPTLYKDKILPPILEQIVSCNDALAQAYLMDCIIQVFPDNFHIETLPIFVQVCPKLKEKVNVRTILQGLMDRLSNYYKVNTNQQISMDTFQNLHKCVQLISQKRITALHNQTQNNKIPKPNHSEIIHLDTYLFQFSLLNYPDQFVHLNDILNECADTLNVFCATSTMNDAAMVDLEALLMIPLDKLSLKVLELKSFGLLLEFLPWDKRQKVGKGLIQAVIADGKGLTDIDVLESLLKIITPLLKNVPEHMKAGTILKNDLDKDQLLVSKFVHLLDHQDTDTLYQMLNIMKKYLSEGGKDRIEKPLTSLVFASIRLVNRVYDLEFVKHEEIIEETKEIPMETQEDKTTSNEDTETHKDEKDEENEDEENTENNDEVKTADDKEENDEPEVEASDTSNTEDKDEDSDKLEDMKDLSINDDQAKESTIEEEDTENKESEETTADENSENKSTEENEDETKENDISNLSSEDNKAHLFGEVQPAKESTQKVLIFNKNTNCRRIFLFLQNIVSSITTINPELAYKLYLQIALVASSYVAPSISTDFNSIAYEYLVQAFSIYEDDISDPKKQVSAMTAMVGTLLSCRTFDETSVVTLVTKTAQCSARLVKKMDQCKMVSLCSYLFYTGDDNDPNAYRHPERVLECLQRSLKLADACTTASASNVYLFIEILEHYIYYFEKGTPLITDRFVSGLIALIKEHLVNVKDQDISLHFKQVLKYVQEKKADGQALNKKFTKVVC